MNPKENKACWSNIVDRQTGLLTDSQNNILRHTKVLILGLGGMGMNTASCLARMGFENFTLIDCDEIDGTSFNRNPFAFDDTINLQKVEATKQYLKKINPEAQITIYPSMKFGLNTDPSFFTELLEQHDAMCWAMDGLAGRIYYTRLALAYANKSQRKIPTVESWALPYHLTVWSPPVEPNAISWEACFNLPTTGIEIENISDDLLRTSQLEFFQTLGATPRLWESIDPELKEQWLSLKIPNRSLGALVTASGALSAHELMVNVLEANNEPIKHATAHKCPWMVIYDVHRNLAYDYNFKSKTIRWTHPLTLETVEESI
jgi:hypothetical protein